MTHSPTGTEMKLNTSRILTAALGFAASVALCSTSAAIAKAEPAVPTEPAARLPKTEMGIAQLPNEKMDWILDAKFGMFIHWGLYSGPGRGEWVMEHEGISPEKYRQFAFP